MKEVGNWTGSLIAAIYGRNIVGDFSNFYWWEIVLITFYIISVSIVGGFLGAVIQEKSVKLIAKWNGKKKG